MTDIDVFIGLEIHVQLMTNSKMFCTCKAKFGEDPNTNVCPVCLGYPGMLPVPNMQALEYAYTLAQSLQCTLAPKVQFDRKNYYYPDLPKNYQITQFYHPCGEEGKFDFNFQGKVQSVAIKEAHLEEDAGKLIHTSDITLCDYNRSGTPLMEVVTQPDIHSPEEAEQLLKQFRQLVRYLGVCDGNMEEGSMRCDANVSINHKGKGLGSKVEIKNVNSFRFVRMALQYEIERQSVLLQENQTIAQETRLWNENRDVTEGMRVKEEANDYRYIPEPDIIPYKLPQSFFDEINTRVVELPLQRKARLENSFSLPENTLSFILEEKSTADFFESTIEKGANPELVGTWLIGDVQKLLNKHNLSLDNSPLTPNRLARMLVLLQESKLHGKLAKQVIEKIFSDDLDTDDIISKYKLQAASNEEIIQAIRKVLQENPEAVTQYQEGDSKPIGFFIGRIMECTGGKAEPKAVQNILLEQLKSIAK